MKILSKLVPLFIIVPLVELAILIKVGQRIGAWNTIGLVIATGFLGAFLMKLEGLRIFANLQSELMQAKMPTNQLIDGALILVGGIVLLTPGIITDVIGFTLLLPLTRPLYRNWLKKKFEGKIKTGQGFYANQRKKAEVIEVIEGPKSED